MTKQSVVQIFISTSTPKAIVGVIYHDRKWFYESFDPTGHHEWLAKVFHHGLKVPWLPPKVQDYKLVVDVGPGSFTGLRVGLGYVKGLALWLPSKIQSCTSLELIWASADFPNPAVVAMNAFGQKVYIWESFNPIPRVIPVSEWIARWDQYPPKTKFLGDGCETLGLTNLVKEKGFWLGLRYPDVTGFLHLVHRKTELLKSESIHVLPLYLKPSSAEERLIQKSK